MGKTYKIAVIGGDGTGPEVADEAVKVLKAAADKFDFKVELTDYDFGGESNVLEVYIRYLRQKLEAEDEVRLLHTVRGVGYVLREE